MRATRQRVASWRRRAPRPEARRRRRTILDGDETSKPNVERQRESDEGSRIGNQSRRAALARTSLDWTTDPRAPELRACRGSGGGRVAAMAGLHCWYGEGAFAAPLASGRLSERACMATLPERLRGPLTRSGRGAARLAADATCARGVADRPGARSHGPRRPGGWRLHTPGTPGAPQRPSASARFTIRGVRKITSSFRASLARRRWKRMPRIGISPKNGT